MHVQYCIFLAMETNFNLHDIWKVKNQENDRKLYLRIVTACELKA